MCTWQNTYASVEWRVREVTVFDKPCLIRGNAVTNGLIDLRGGTFQSSYRVELGDGDGISNPS